jgi:hypothetical protein
MLAAEKLAAAQVVVVAAQDLLLVVAPTEMGVLAGLVLHQI